MSGVLIHDGRRPGQRAWTVAAVRSGIASGAMLTAFSTPRIAAPRHPNAKTVAEDVGAAGGEVLFDVMTHARMLPSTDKVDFYNQWELWGPSGVGLGTEQQRLEHVERVFDRQDQLGAARLTPTLQLSNPHSANARIALATGRLAAGFASGAGQSLVGTRSFWSAGVALDAYVGSLVSLRAPFWVVTLANDVVIDNVPDMLDSVAQAGLARTVHSLSLRSRVILAHADYAGLPSIAAGADTVGSGWDRGQRTYDPLTFHVNSDPGIRIPASYVTQGALHAVLRRSVAEAIDRWNPARATQIRGGPMPPSDQAQREHHLHQLSGTIAEINAHSRRDRRVAVLRERYHAAQDTFAELMRDIPGVVGAADRAAWADNPSAALEAYAVAEGI